MHAQGLVELRVARVGDRDVDGATVASGRFWRSTRPASSRRSISRVVPPVECTMASAIWFILSRPSGDSPQLQEDVEPGEGHLALVLESSAETARESGVRVEQQTEERHPLVTRGTRVLRARHCHGRIIPYS